MGCQFLLGAVLLAISSLLHAQSPLRVMTFPGGGNLPLWVAEDKGLFARERLAVSVSPTPNSVVLFQNLASGEQDIAMAAFDNVVAYQEGQGEVALSTTPDFFAFMGFTCGTVRLVVGPDIKGYDDLRGKSLGVDALTTGYSLVLRKLLQLGGLKEGDYHLMSVGGTGTRAQALMQNKFSGTILTTPLEIIPESRGYRRLANAVDVLGPYQTIVGISRREWATVRLFRSQEMLCCWRRDGIPMWHRWTLTGAEWKRQRQVSSWTRDSGPRLAECGRLGTSQAVCASRMWPITRRGLWSATLFSRSRGRPTTPWFPASRLPSPSWPVWD